MTNPLADEPAARDCERVKRFGRLGLIWCGLLAALLRWRKGET